MSKIRTEKDLWIEMSIREIWTQTHFAEIAFNNIKTKGVTSTDITFSSIHSFLSHCANTSKMLKANDSNCNNNICNKFFYKILDVFRKKQEVIVIGDILNIQQSSIIHSRKFRNHLEHYDERLKTWIKQKGVNVNIGTYNISPKSMIGGPDMLYVTHFDPTNNTFTFVDKDLDLYALYREAKKINEISDNWVKKVEQGVIDAPYY